MLSSAASQPTDWEKTEISDARLRSIWKVLGDIPTATPGVACIANQKGGVGKTTTAVNLAAALAVRGRRVLVVDVDPQSNATTGLGLDPRAARPSTYELLIGDARVAQVVRATKLEGLDLAPASPDLAGAEVELVGTPERERRLRAALVGIERAYDLVVLDCPPSLGLLTVNALVAARSLIVPVQCEYYALEGLGQLLGTAERVCGALNDELRITGFLLTMYDARTKLSEQVAAEVRGHFGDLVYGTVIPRSVRLSEAPSYGEPVVTIDPGARGSIAYSLLAREVEERYGLADRGSTREAAPLEGPASEAASTPEPPSALGGPASEAASTPEPPLKVTPAGPGGRGHGTVAPAPPRLVDAHPRPAPWREPV